MLRVASTERRTNESILQEIGEMRGGLLLLKRAARQTMLFFGHVMRADDLHREGDYVGTWRGKEEEEEETAAEKADGGDHGGNLDGAWRN